MDCRHLFRLVEEKKIHPDFIIFDLEMEDARGFMIRYVKSNKQTCVITYPEDGLGEDEIVPVFSKQMPYTEVREV